MLFTARLLSAAVEVVDSAGRLSGGLPDSLSNLLAQRHFQDTDIWGRPLRYVVQTPGFELRSAGQDGRFGTADDVVATGQLGRNVPCEIRTELGVVPYDSVGSTCGSRVAEIVPLCPMLLMNKLVREPPIITRRDSVLLTGERLVRFARSVDGVGREAGVLPPSLRTVPGYPSVPNGWEFADVWGRAVRYLRMQPDFELRSSGSNGVFEDSDDIVVRARLGRTIPCEFRAGQETLTCDVPPPPCPDGG